MVGNYAGYSCTKIGPHTMIYGVYACNDLDLKKFFGPVVDTIPGLTMYDPSQVPDPNLITVALAWRPALGDLGRYPNLRLVQSIAAGVDGILADQSLPKDAVITRVRDQGQAQMMAGFAAFHVLWHHRKMGIYVQSQREHRWKRFAFSKMQPPHSVHVGVLGYGHMGQAVAHGCVALGYQVSAACRYGSVANDRGNGGVEVKSGSSAILEVAAKSDILINVLPLTDETLGVLNAKLFSIMPEGAALVHLGRGEHLVEEDLIAVLDSGHLSGASLDVFVEEPLPPSHPFWSHPKIFLTPHEASVVPAQSVADAFKMGLTSLRNGSAHQAIVQRDRGY